MGEICYDQQGLDDPNRDKYLLTRSDISFSPDHDYTLMRLKSSKTDWAKTGVEVMLASTNDPTDKLDQVQALKAPFTLDPKPPSAPLFRTERTPFSRKMFAEGLSG